MMNVLITGISKGLGRELANLYARCGHTVFGLSRNAPSGISSKIVWKPVDITDDSCERRVFELLENCNDVDLLINNAGCGSSGSHLMAVDTNILKGQVDLHCIGVLRVTRAAIPFLRKAESPKVINVTSRLGSIVRHQRGS